MAVPFVPKNRAATEHRGSVDRIIHSDPSQPFVILALTDGATILGDADAEQFARGTQYRFFGRWQDDAKRGPRFRFSTFVVHHAHGRAGVVRYITKVCEDITEKAAGRIFDAFREESVSTLRTDPATVAAKCKIDLGLCELAAIQLASDSRHEDTRIELFGMFAGRGFQGKLIEAAIAKWGVRAPSAIKKNPFALLGLPSAGFKRCDKLWADLKLPAAALKRAGLCAWNVLRNETQGHTWVPAEEVAEKLAAAVPGCEVKKALRFALRARRLKKHLDASGRCWLSVYNRGTAEERIATAIARLSAAPNLWPTDRVPVSRQDGDRLPSAHQVERLQRATAGPVGLLLGGPGTGKSHSLAYLLREVIESYGRSNVCACAPTGKAANRVSQALALAGIGVTAFTIHTTLGIQRNGHDGDGWGFAYNLGNPMPYRFVICDETSMIDTDLMADLLDACATGTQVLFVGDPYQLPPVGHGAPLRDLIGARVPQGELTEVRRNAGQIVHACVRIKNGESFDVADAVDLAALPPKNLKLLEARDDAHAAEVLVDALKHMKERYGSDPTWQTQVIVARNVKGDVSRKKLNELLHPLLNPDGYGVTGNPFKVGDKIICTKNNYLHQVEPMGRFHADCAEQMAREAANYEVVRDEDSEPVEVYVANGEIGRVVAIAEKLTVARFSEGDALVKIPMGKQRDEDASEGGEEDDGGRGCNFDHAYTVTCHKLQGSESPCVIVMGDDGASSLATREWIYTAISRASKLCVLIGKKATFTKMKDRRQLNKRKTFLKERVLETRYAEL